MTTSPSPEPPDAPYDHLFGGQWESAASQSEPARYPYAPGQRYILPCAVLGLGGLYEYVMINRDAARRWLLGGACTSFVTHPQLKAELDRVVGIFTPPGLPGMPQQLGYHDEALLWQVEGFELLAWQGRGNSKRLRQMVEDGCWTLGLLRKLA